MRNRRSTNNVNNNDNNTNVMMKDHIIHKMNNNNNNNSIYYIIIIIFLTIIIIINYYNNYIVNNNINNDNNIIINSCQDLSKYKNVLITAAHPDDIEALCGGTVAFMKSCGIEINAVLTTSGDLGFGKNMSLSNNEIANMREQEALNAAAILGISNITFLRNPDGRLEGVDQIELKLNISKAVRLYRPDLLLSFSPEIDYSSYQFGFMHQDHQTTGQVTMNVLWPTCRDGLNFKNELLDNGYQPIIIPEIWLFTFSKIKLTDDPYILVNISQHFNTKYEALKEHVSQYDSPDDLKKWLAKIGTYLTTTFISKNPQPSTLIEAFTSVKFYN